MGAVELIDTKELRRLAQTATPGPWHATKSVETNSWAVWSDTTRLMELRPTKTVDMYQVSNTAAFIAAVNPAAVSELLDRLEAAEKDIALKERIIDSLGSELNAVANERDELRARIEEMERQEPVAWMLNCPTLGGDTGWILSWTQSGAGLCNRLQGEENEKRLYALPGAKGE